MTYEPKFQIGQTVYSLEYSTPTGGFHVNELTISGISINEETSNLRYDSKESKYWHDEASLFASRFDAAMHIYNTGATLRKKWSTWTPPIPEPQEPQEAEEVCGGETCPNCQGPFGCYCKVKTT